MSSTRRSSRAAELEWVICRGARSDRSTKTGFHATGEARAPRRDGVSRNRVRPRGVRRHAYPVCGGAAPPASAQAKKLVLWTHWEQNPEFNKFYETRGKDFAQKTGWEVQVVTVPYQGYEAKYDKYVVTFSRRRPGFKNQPSRK